MAEIAAPQIRTRSLRVTAQLGWLIPSALFILALAPRISLVVQNQFDGLYGQDAYAYYGYARQLFTALTHGQLPPPFWWPLGYPALLNVSFLLLGVSVHSAQWFTLVSGAVLAPLAFWFAYEVSGGDRTAGVIAGMILALGGQAVQSSVVVMADVPALMWATLSACLLLRYQRTRAASGPGNPAPTKSYNSGWMLYASAITMALALVTRWENAGFALAWVGALLMLETRSLQANLRLAEIGFLWRSLFKLAIAFALAALIVLPQLTFQFTHAAPLAGQSWLEGWSPANFLVRSFDTVDGHFVYALPVAFFYAQVIAHPAYVFPLLTPFVLLGAWHLGQNARRNPAAAILVLGWIGIMYLFLAGIPYENFRFGLGFITPVAVLAGVGVAQLYRRGVEFNAPTKLGLALVLVATFAGMLVWEPHVLQPILAQKQMELTQLKWLAARVPSNARLYTFASTEALQEYSTLQVADLSDETPQTINVDAHAVSPTYVFLNVDNIESQWGGHNLQRTYDALRTSGSLREIGQLNGWTLFQVGAAP